MRTPSRNGIGARLSRRAAYVVSWMAASSLAQPRASEDAAPEAVTSEATPERSSQGAVDPAPGASWQLPTEPEEAETDPVPEESELPSEVPPSAAQNETASEGARDPSVKTEAPRYALPPPSETPPEPVDYAAVPWTHHQLRWDVQLGVRTSFISARGYDPFAENDSLTQVSVSAGRGVWGDGRRLSLAVHGVWEMGGSSAKARGDDALYSLHRFAVALEGRYHAWHWLYGYGRLTPGMLLRRARLETPAPAIVYEDTTWTFGVDAALGAAARLLGDPDGRSSGERLWVFFEAGYGWSGAHDLTLKAVSGAPERSEARQLGELSLAGPFGRLGLNLTL